jgi:hypothetical protein
MIDTGFFAAYNLTQHPGAAPHLSADPARRRQPLGDGQAFATKGVG